jgi:outer membrane protein TolC
MGKRSQREAELRYDLGQRTSIDVLRAKANVISLESKQLAYGEERQAALDQLLEYSGVDASEMKGLGLDQFSDKETSLEEAVAQFSESETFRREVAPYLSEEGRTAALQKLSTESPSYHSVLAEEEVAQSQAALLSAQDWPDIAVTGAVYSQNRDWSTLFSGQFVSYSASIVLTIPLYLGGSVFSANAERRHAEKAAQLKRERDALRLRNDMETQRLRIVSLERTVDSFRVSVEQYAEIVRLSEKSYELGKTTIVELLGSQNDLLDAKSSFAKARLDFSVALRRYAALLGVTAK